MADVPFHFLLLGIGCLIDDWGYANPTRLQEYINNDPNFGIRPPLSQCRLAFDLMELAGLIAKSSPDNYTRHYM